MNSIINEDRLRELVREEARKMKPEKQSWKLWVSAVYASVLLLAAYLGILLVGINARLSRLETIVATDREFAHGVAGGIPDAPRNHNYLEPDPRLGPPVSIQPRAIAESELPKPGEGQ